MNRCVGSPATLYKPTDPPVSCTRHLSTTHRGSRAAQRVPDARHTGATERLAINLSSRRVRRANELMQGVRNGQPIEVLLGIEFERGLHDATTRSANPIVLNDLKPLFRKAFPIKRTKIPQAGHPDQGPEIVPDYSVANGLDIIAANKFPSGVQDLPAAGQLQARRAREDPGPHPRTRSMRSRMW